MLDGEETLDRFQLDIDGEAVRLITIYSPIAKDLRFLLMVARINTELERIGDQAVNNCEFMEMFLSSPRPADPRPVGDVSHRVGMLNGALQAFAAEDLDCAPRPGADDEVDR